LLLILLHAWHECEDQRVWHRFWTRVLLYLHNWLLLEKRLPL
jgi:hypothetical protein